jgi:hypothetical protein
LTDEAARNGEDVTAIVLIGILAKTTPAEVTRGPGGPDDPRA